MRAGAQLEVTAYDRTQTTKLATGTLTTIDNQIDPTTGTFKLKAQFPNDDEGLFPNQFVNVQLLVDTQHDVTTIPTSAVQRGAPGTFVYLVKPDDTVTLSIKRGEKEMDLKVTLGRKSDVDRGEFQNKMGSELSNRRPGFPAVIQHDTVLKASECGGPLVDLDGNVLGINIARAGRVETWALPGEVIRPLVSQLKEKKFPVTVETTTETKSEKK